jgi:hypothetical protein
MNYLEIQKKFNIWLRDNEESSKIKIISFCNQNNAFMNYKKNRKMEDKKKLKTS